MPDLGKCQCGEQDFPCTAVPTSEDLRCDACRPGTCVLVQLIVQEPGSVLEEIVDTGHCSQEEARRQVEEMVRELRPALEPPSGRGEC